MNNIYKACSRCGKVHSLNHRCYANSKNYYQADPKVRKFRNSTSWKSKTEEIKIRDKYLCQICLSNNIFNYKQIEIHHIIPLSIDWQKRLDNYNLIALCNTCHRLAETNKIDKELLLRIAKGNQDNES